MDCRKTIYFSLVLWSALAALPAAAVQPPANQESDSTSIELGNLDDPQPEAPAASAAAGAQALPAQGPAGASAAPQADSQDGVVAASDEAREKAKTPMERYRDLKVQQLTNPSAGTPANPALVRRYLKVDRATYMEAAGVQ